jgi:transposase
MRNSGFALTGVAELGDLTRFDNPRQLAVFVGLVPSEYTSGSARRQGGITKAGNGRARRVLVEAAWAYRHPAKVSLHIQQRIDQRPKALQDLGWKAQVRLCKRYRRLVARGKHPTVVVTAIARELIAFYVGHRSGAAHARVTVARGGGRTWTTDTGVILDDVRGGSGRPSA